MVLAPQLVIPALLPPPLFSSLALQHYSSLPFFSSSFLFFPLFLHYLLLVLPFMALCAGDRPQAGNALCLETSWGWKELWVGFYSWLDTPEKKFMASDWKWLWAGSLHGLETTSDWRRLWPGNSSRLEATSGWKQP